MEENKQTDTHDEAKELARKQNIKKWIRIGIVIALCIAVIFAIYWWFFIRNRVYTDKVTVEAPIIALSPDAPGVLKEVLVKDGDRVATNTPVARVGDSYILTTTSGIIVDTTDTLGATFSPGQAVVSMVNPADMYLDALVDENAGLADIKPGDKVVFTLDAFGSKKFDGVVDTIVPTSYESSVVFTISDQREEQEFEVKIDFDAVDHPEILNGMSARAWIYK